MEFGHFAAPTGALLLILTTHLQPVVPNASVTVFDTRPPVVILGKPAYGGTVVVDNLNPAPTWTMTRVSVAPSTGVDIIDATDGVNTARKFRFWTTWVEGQAGVRQEALEAWLAEHGSATGRLLADIERAVGGR